MKLALHIERVVIDGLPIDPRHGTTVRTAIESELARLLADRGLEAALARGGAHPRLAGAALVLDTALAPAPLGARIAAAVHHSLAAPDTRRRERGSVAGARRAPHATRTP